MIASHEGHTDIVKLLFEKGANTNLQNKAGQTALMIASEKGHTEVVELLKKAEEQQGSDGKSSDKHGMRSEESVLSDEEARAIIETQIRPKEQDFIADENIAPSDRLAA